jgi:hypothetical protein
MEQFDDLLAGFDLTLTDDIVYRIDEIVPPALANSSLRRRPA